MINANELRLGNTVGVYTGDEWAKYKQIIDHEDLAENWCAEYYPIPLTPEILLAFGFEKLPGARAMFRIFIDDLEISVSTELYFAYIDTQWGQAPIKKPIFKYLHQLQNLVFALTGQELSYSPNKVK